MLNYCHLVLNHAGPLRPGRFAELQWSHFSRHRLGVVQILAELQSLYSFPFNPVGASLFTVKGAEKLCGQLQSYLIVKESVLKAIITITIALQCIKTSSEHLKNCMHTRNALTLCLHGETPVMFSLEDEPLSLYVEEILSGKWYNL